jgi:hypothetical protein
LTFSYGGKIKAFSYLNLHRGVVPKKTMEEDEEIVFVYKIFQDIFSLDLQSYFVK